MSDIVSKIRQAQKQRHDTLYCNERAKKTIIGTISGAGRGLRADNLTISGLEVITHEKFVQPIVCERGEVFDLTKDYKCGRVEPTDI